MTGRRGRRRKQLLDEMMLEVERGSTRSHSVENSLWKKLCTCRRTDYGMTEVIADTCKRKEMLFIYVELKVVMKFKRRRTCRYTRNTFKKVTSYVSAKQMVHFAFSSSF